MRSPGVQVLSIVPGDGVRVTGNPHRNTARKSTKIESHADAPFSNMEHSIGRWEDGVLVVDTRNFSDHRRGLGFGGLASGPQKHPVERFALRADGTAIDYSFPLADPDRLAEPVTGTLELTHTPGRPFIMEPCDLESGGRYLTE